MLLINCFFVRNTLLSKWYVKSTIRFTISFPFSSKVGMLESWPLCSQSLENEVSLITFNETEKLDPVSLQVRICQTS